MKKIIFCMILLLFTVGFVMADDSVVQQTTTTQEGTSTPDTVITEESPVPPASSQIGWIWLPVILVIGILIILPWLVNTTWNITVRRKIMDEMRSIPDTSEKLKYYDKLLEPFPERKGLSRYSLMLAVTLIVGTVVLYLVLVNPESELLKNTIGVLTGALASIIGFFFGGRAVEGGVEEGQTKTEEKTGADTKKT